VAEGVIAARTLLNGDTYHSAIRVINLSDHDFMINKDVQLGEARMGQIVETDGAIDAANADHFDAESVIDRPTVETCQTTNGRITQSAGSCFVQPSYGPDLTDSSPQGLLSDEYKHLQCLVDTLPANLTADQYQQATEFIIKNAPIFSSSEFDLGCTNLVEHAIDTGSNRPVR